ncbi:MAG: hypothetical protein AAF335_02135, partial [Bacteroidota bacterium]
MDNKIKLTRLFICLLIGSTPSLASEASEKKNVLVIGPEGAGKKTLIKRLKGSPLKPQYAGNIKLFSYIINYARSTVTSLKVEGNGGASQVKNVDFITVNFDPNNTGGLSKKVEKAVGQKEIDCVLLVLSASALEHEGPGFTDSADDSRQDANNILDCLEKLLKDVQKKIVFTHIDKLEKDRLKDMPLLKKDLLKHCVGRNNENIELIIFDPLNRVEEGDENGMYEINKFIHGDNVPLAGTAIGTLKQQEIASFKQKLYVIANLDEQWENDANKLKEIIEAYKEEYKNLEEELTKKWARYMGSLSQKEKERHPGIEEIPNEILSLIKKDNFEKVLEKLQEKLQETLEAIGNNGSDEQETPEKFTDRRLEENRRSLQEKFTQLGLDKVNVEKLKEENDDIETLKQKKSQLGKDVFPFFSELCEKFNDDLVELLAEKNDLTPLQNLKGMHDGELGATYNALYGEVLKVYEKVIKEKEEAQGVIAPKRSQQIKGFWKSKYEQKEALLGTMLDNEIPDLNQNSSSEELNAAIKKLTDQKDEIINKIITAEWNNIALDIGNGEQEAMVPTKSEQELSDRQKENYEATLRQKLDEIIITKK